MKFFKMTEQDLREEINIKIVNYTTGLDNYSHTLDKCVQIAKDYSEKEAIEFYEWRSTTPIKNIDQYTNKEAYQLFKNIENER